MKRVVPALVATLVMALSLPAVAAAKKTGTTYVPPGLSGASQYVEVVPSAGGGTPASSINGHHHQSAVGTGGGSGSGGSGGGGESSISAATVSQMNAHGATGAAAAALAQAGAPGSVAAHAGSQSTTSTTQGTVGRSHGTPIAQVVGTAVGASGGMGVVLPIILIGSLVVISGLGIAKLRRTP